jgi:hypothetical protein
MTHVLQKIVRRKLSMHPDFVKNAEREPAFIADRNLWPQNVWIPTSLNVGIAEPRRTRANLK